MTMKFTPNEKASIYFKLVLNKSLQNDFEARKSRPLRGRPI